MLRQNHTDPSWLRSQATKTRGSGKTADQLLSEKLDWDGRESPSCVQDINRDIVLFPKECVDEDTGPPRLTARPPLDRRKSSTSTTRATPVLDWTTLEEENMLLKRQIEVLRERRLCPASRRCIVQRVELPAEQLHLCPVLSHSRRALWRT